MAATFGTDCAHIGALMGQNLRAGIRAIPCQHLYRVAADAADLVHAPIVDGAAFAALGPVLEAVFLQRDDHARAGRQDVDGGGNGVIGIKQHRACFIGQCLHQQPLGGQHFVEADLVHADTTSLGDGVEQRRTLIEGDHREIAVGIGQTGQAALFSESGHGCCLHSVSVSASPGMPPRPRGLVHFKAAAAAAKAIASATASPAPSASA